VEGLKNSPTLQLSPKTTALKVWKRISMSLLLATPVVRTQILFPLVMKIWLPPVTCLTFKTLLEWNAIARPCQAPTRISLTSLRGRTYFWTCASGQDICTTVTSEEQEANGEHLESSHVQDDIYYGGLKRNLLAPVHSGCHIWHIRV
jgi:hypothetical protein